MRHKRKLSTQCSFLSVILKNTSNGCHTIEHCMGISSQIRYFITTEFLHLLLRHSFYGETSSVVPQNDVFTQSNLTTTLYEEPCGGLQWNITDKRPWEHSVFSPYLPNVWHRISDWGEQCSEHRFTFINILIKIVINLWDILLPMCAFINLHNFW